MAQRTPRGRTKAATTTARRIPYQLWIDRKLQRISLKRVAAPATKARKPARATRVKHSARAFTSRTSVLAAMVVLAGAVIIAARGGSRPAESAVAAAPPPAAALPQDLALPVERATRPTVDASALQTAAGPNPGRSSVAMTTAPAALKTPAANPAPVAEEEMTAAAAEPVSLTAAAPTPAAQLTAPAALAGCLVFDGGTYRLKDASGADAPKSRSWKSGFLRRRTADIDIIDAGHSLSLAAHVGQRIEVTGTLVDREMRARSVQRLADTCKP